MRTFLSSTEVTEHLIAELDRYLYVFGGWTSKVENCTSYDELTMLVKGEITTFDMTEMCSMKPALLKLLVDLVDWTKVTNHILYTFAKTGKTIQFKIPIIN